MNKLKIIGTFFILSTLLNAPLYGSTEGENDLNEVKEKTTFFQSVQKNISDYKKEIVIGSAIVGGGAIAAGIIADIAFKIYVVSTLSGLNVNMNKIINSPIIPAACEEIIQNIDSYTTVYDQYCPKGYKTVPSIWTVPDGNSGYFEGFNCNNFWTGFYTHIHPDNSTHLLYDPKSYGLVKFRKGAVVPKCLAKTCVEGGDLLAPNAGGKIINDLCPGTVDLTMSTEQIKRRISTLGEKIIRKPQREEIKINQKNMKCEIKIKNNKRNKF